MEAGLYYYGARYLFMQSFFLGPLYWPVIAVPTFTRATSINVGILKYLANMKYNDYYKSYYTEKWAEAWKPKN